MCDVFAILLLVDSVLIDRRLLLRSKYLCIHRCCIVHRRTVCLQKGSSHAAIVKIKNAPWKYFLGRPKT